MSDFREANKGPMKVLALLEVVQIDVLEEYQLLIVLSGELRRSHLTCMRSSLLRATSYHLSLGCARSSRSDGWFEAGQTDFLAYIILQSRLLLRENACLHSQIQPAFQYV